MILPILPQSLPICPSSRTPLLNKQPWDRLLPEIICECAKQTLAKKYTHFGIQNYAECWSGLNAKVRGYYY